MFATAPPPPQRLLVFAKLADTEITSDLGEPTDQMDIEILWEPTPDANHETLRRAFGERALAMQTGATPGARMAMAMSERFFFHRTQAIVAITAAVKRATIDHAFSLLDSCEWVLGFDYLIGCRAGAFDVSFFRGDAPVMQRIREAESTLAVLPVRT